MKVCRVAKDIKEVKFGYIRGDLGSGGCGDVSGDSGSQGVWEYLGLALVFVWGSTSYFSKNFSSSIDKAFLLVGGLGTRLSFYKF